MQTIAQPLSPDGRVFGNTSRDIDCRDTTILRELCDAHLTMDFRDVCDTFGGTPFYDDLHVDVVTARAKLQTRASSAFSPSVDGNASLLLLKAILHIIEGDYPAAYGCLDALRNANVYGRHSRRWNNRAELYTALLCVCKDFPAVLQPCDIRGPMRQVLTSQQGYDNGFNCIAHCLLHEHGSSTMDSLEIRTITAIWLYHHTLSTAFRKNVVAGSCDSMGVQLETNTMIDGMLSSALCTSRDLQLPSLSGYIRKLQFRVAHACGKLSAISYLQRTREMYNASEDDVGMGEYCLLFGDWILSPSFTSPVVLNFLVVDDMDEWGGNCTMFFAENEAYKTGLESRSSQTAESDIDLDRRQIDSRISAALLWYDKANKYFASVSSSRGQAASLLRGACAMRMRSIQPASLWGQERYDEPYVDLLESSIELAKRCSDVQLLTLAKIHLWSHTSTGRDYRSEQLDTGDRFIKTGNEILGLGLALFALRTGHYARYVLGSALHAHAGYETCRQIVKPMECIRPIWCDVMLAQLRLSLSRGEMQHAVTWIGHLKDEWESIIDGCGPQDAFIMGENMRGWYTAAILEAIALVGPVGDAAAGFPDGRTVEIMGVLAAFAPTEYVEGLQEQFHYTRVLALYRGYLGRGDLSAAFNTLEGYSGRVTVSIATGRPTLTQLLNRANVKSMLDEQHVSAEYLLLNFVRSTDVLPMLHHPIILEEGYAEDVSKRDTRRSRVKSVEAMFLSYVQARSWPKAARLMLALDRLSPGFFTSVTSHTNLWPWQRCLYAGLVLERQRNYQEAWRYFAQGRAFVQRESLLTPHSSYRLFLKLPDVTRLMGSGARLALRFGQTHPGSSTIPATSNRAINCTIYQMFGPSYHYEHPRKHFEEAVLFLEAARPQYMWGGNKQVPTVQQAEAIRNYELWKELVVKPDRTPAEEIEFEQLHSQREDLLRQFRETEESRNDAAEVRHDPLPLQFASIPQDSVVAYLFLTSDGCLVLGIDEVAVRIGAFCPMATPNSMEQYITMYLGAIENDVPELVDLIGGFLSRILIEPLAGCIDKRAHVIFVVSGVLTRIPFGALKYKGQYLALQKMVSQVPSLRALHFLHQRRSSNPEPRRLRLNAVARPGAAGNQWLPMAGLEAMRIANIGGSALRAEEVSQQGFRDLIRDSDFLHICTHGRYDADFPFNSHLLLKESFRVLDMMAVQSEVLLVTFSACLSGVGRASDAGDVQGFSHAVLAAGANCYLGALWEVNDVATMLHMSIFYKCLIQAQLGCTIAFAWGVATNWLYHLSLDQAIEQLRKFIQLWDQWEHDGKKPADLTGKSAKRKLQKIITDWEQGKNVLDFKSPRIWAPFMLAGNASRHIDVSTPDGSRFCSLESPVEQ